MVEVKCVTRGNSGMRWDEVIDVNSDIVEEMQSIV